MPDPFDAHRFEQNKRRLGAEGYKEGCEGILRAIDTFTERRERFKRLFPGEFETLTRAIKEKRLPSVMIGYAVFHPISFRAVQDTLVEFGGRALCSPQDEEQFAVRTSTRTTEIIHSFRSCPPEFIAKTKADYPEVDIELLTNAHAKGIISDSDLLASFQFQSSLESSLQKIAAHRLEQEYKL